MSTTRCSEKKFNRCVIVYWHNPQLLPTWGLTVVQTLLIVGTNFIQSSSDKNVTHTPGIKYHVFQQPYTQLINSMFMNILALESYILGLSPVSTSSTTSITSFAKASIIKTTGCGRMEWI